MTSLMTIQSQIIDDFSASDGNLSSNWEGDRDKFVITEDQQLRLSDEGAGSAMLFQRGTWQQEMSWEMHLVMDFDPSNSNRLEVFLATDRTPIERNNGYVIALGENGSLDAIRLKSLINGQEEVIGSGTSGLIARGPVNLTLRATLESNFLRIEVDPEGGICFETEIEAPTEPLLTAEFFYFGWECTYTATRSDRFFFDNIYVGTPRVDLESPEIDEVIASANEVNLNFSEPLDESSFDPSTIILSPDIPDKEILLRKNQLSITTSEGFENDITYNMSIAGIADLSGNEIDTNLNFVVALDPSLGSLLINEILFNPVSDGSDYVEIVNMSSGLISIRNVVLTNSDNGDSNLLADIPDLESGAFLVLTDNKSDVMTRFSNHQANRIFEVDIPRFNNTDGNVTISINELILDSFDYDEDFHQRLLDDVEGISLERISLLSDTNDADSWTSASASVDFGTPGLPNSNSGIAATLNSVELVNKIFSPNGDGQSDEAELTYNFDGPGYVGTVRIFNERGQQIKTLLNNEILSISGTITWDGRDSSNSIAPIGIYIIHLDFFNVNGNRFQKKFTCGLGDFLN